MPRDTRVGCGTSLILYEPQLREPAKIWLGLRVGTLEPGKWGMPGGWLDFGEQPVEGVVRELQEETGLFKHPLLIDAHGVFAHPLQSIDCWCATLYFSVEHYMHSEEDRPKVMEPDKMSQWQLFHKWELEDLADKGLLMGSIPAALKKFYGTF